MAHPQCSLSLACWKHRENRSTGGRDARATSPRRRRSEIRCNDPHGAPADGSAGFSRHWNSRALARVAGRRPAIHDAALVGGAPCFSRVAPASSRCLASPGERGRSETRPYPAGATVLEFLSIMDLTPLRRHRDYRLLFAAQFVTFLGTMVTYVAMPYQMYTLTRSSLAVGLLGIAELIPLLLTAFVGGALADSIDRRKMVIVTEIGLGTGSCILMWNAALNHPQVWVLYFVSGFMSALTGLQRPSLESLTPRLVEPEEIPATAGLATFRGSVGMVAGPALGGVLISAAGLPAT